MKYLATIGLELHVQLNTKSKMFCGCSTQFGATPNTNVCPVCLGYPGALPVMNESAIRMTVLAGLMLGARINGHSKFDRKSYFYPDMPKNYQISQYDMPLCVGGSVEIEVNGEKRAILVKRVHLEEDVGKSSHFESVSGVDFNRAGIPLMEIVTEPDIGSPEEAYAYLLALKQILLYSGVSNCNLEEGNARCDVNCSLRPESQAELGVKTEIKNLNTFKGVLNSLKSEIARQTRVLEAGGSISQETRRWDAETGATIEMRSKESAHDYRYFPEPDLMPVVLSPELVETWRATLPELPNARRQRFAAQYGLPDYDAGVLVADKAVADYFESAAALSYNPKAISNWMMTEMLRLLSEKEKEIVDSRVSPGALASLSRLVETGKINRTTAKEIFAEMFKNGGDPEAIVAQKGLAQVSDAGELERLADQAIAENPKSVADFKSGKTPAFKFLVGQTMKLSKGKADPKLVGRLLEKKLGAGA